MISFLDNLAWILGIFSTIVGSIKIISGIKEGIYYPATLTFTLISFVCWAWIYR